MASNEHREIFGIIVRTIGFIATVYSTYVLCFGILYWLGMPKRTAIEGTLPSLIFGAFYLVIGVLILRRADWIVRLAYCSSSDEPN